MKKHWDRKNQVEDPTENHRIKNGIKCQECENCFELEGILKKQTKVQDSEFAGEEKIALKENERYLDIIATDGRNIKNIQASQERNRNCQEYFEHVRRDPIWKISL